jgi:hypothetical protein
VPDPSLAGPAIIQIGSEGGFLPAPATITPQPVTFNTMGNVDKHALLLGCAERADIIVDFSQVPAGSRLILYNDAPAPTPGGDPLYDFYTGGPDLTAIGGAPSTLPGYGPNMRTIMQFVVDPNGTPTAPFDMTALQTAFATTVSSTGAYAASQPAPLVAQSAYSAAFNTQFTDTYAGLSDTSLPVTPAGSTTTVTLGMLSKSVNEGFDDYGRINARLGTGNFTPTTLQAFGYADAPSEFIKDGETQLWRITHNGMDTHPVHFHLFNVQLVNRIMWNGMVMPPDPNELGWKETIRMSPMEDVVVALQPKRQTLPFSIPDSIRPLDPTMPVSLMNPITNFGWEYVWHCHILGHEENDMMRPMVFRVAPDAPSNLAATPAGNLVILTFTDNSASETGFTLQRSTDSFFSVRVSSFTVPSSTPNTAQGGGIAFTDTSAAPNTKYYYRVQAFSDNGTSWWSNTADITTSGPAATVTNVAAKRIAPHTVKVAWAYRANINAAANFRIERATVTGNVTGAFAAVGTIPAPAATAGKAPQSAHTFTDSSAPDGTTVVYRVITVNNWGDSSPSNTATVSLPAVALAQ